MDGQLEPVRQDIRSVKDEIVKTKQYLAAAKEAKNREQERFLFQLLLILNDQLLSLNNQLGGLQEEKNILLRGQAADDEQEFWLPACFAIPWLVGQQVRHKKQQMHKTKENGHQMKLENVS